MGNGRQRETRKKGYNGRQYRRQDLGKADTPSNTKADTLRKPTPTVHCLGKNAKSDHPPQRETRRKTSWETSWEASWETRETKPRKADTPSNTGKQEGRQWETRGRQDLGKVDAPRNTGHTYLGKQWKAMKTKTSGRWTIQHRHMWGDNWRQRETMGDNGKHVETTGDKDR